MLSKEELGYYLKKIRNSKDISLREVDKKTNISYTHLNMIENGKRNVTPALLRNLANLYNIDYLDLYEKAGYIDLIEDEKKSKILSTPLSDLQQTEIPVLGLVKAGYDYLANENVIGHVYLDFKPTDTENYYALQVTGDSMEPLFSDGDIAIVHKQDNFESGNTCIVLVNGDEATVKKVVRMEDGIDLIAMNPYYPVRHFSKNEMNEIPVKIIGKVIEARKRKIFE